MRQRMTVGSILEIPIFNEYFVYAQILPCKQSAFFDYRSKEPLREFDVLENIPVLFYLSVYTHVVSRGVWLKVGKIPLREEFKIVPLEFIYDKFQKKFSLYDPNTGIITPSDKEQVRGLERAAVWDSNHVEERIRDYYNGDSCIWLKEDNELFE